MRHSFKVSRKLVNRIITGFTSLSFIMSSFPASAIEIKLDQNMNIRMNDGSNMNFVSKVTKGSIISVDGDAKDVVVENGKINIEKTLQKMETTAKAKGDKFPGYYKYQSNRGPEAFFHVTVVTAAAGSSAKAGDKNFMAVEFLNRRGNAYVTEKDEALYVHQPSANAPTSAQASTPVKTASKATKAIDGVNDKTNSETTPAAKPVSTSPQKTTANVTTKPASTKPAAVLAPGALVSKTAATGAVDQATTKTAASTAVDKTTPVKSVPAKSAPLKMVSAKPADAAKPESKPAAKTTEPSADKTATAKPIASADTVQPKSAAPPKPETLALVPAPKPPVAKPAQEPKVAAQKSTEVATVKPAPPQMVAEEIIVTAKPRHKAKPEAKTKVPLKPVEKVSEAEVCTTGCNPQSAASGNIKEIAHAIDSAKEAKAHYQGFPNGTPNECEAFVKSDGSFGEWGELVKGQIEKHSSFSSESAVRSLTPRACPNYGSFSPEEKTHFWVYVIGAIAAQESTCDETATNTHATNGVAAGLMQMENKPSAYRALAALGLSCFAKQRVAKNSIECGLSNMSDRLVGPGHDFYTTYYGWSYWAVLHSNGLTRAIISRYGDCDAVKTPWP